MFRDRAWGVGLGIGHRFRERCRFRDDVLEPMVSHCPDFGPEGFVCVCVCVRGVRVFVCSVKYMCVLCICVYCVCDLWCDIVCVCV